MSNNPSLDDIKSKIDIISLAESYGFEFEKPRGIRYRARTNLLRDEKTSSIDFFTDSQKYYDRGSGAGGDCIDLIQHMENISQSDAINKAKSMAGADVYEVTKRKEAPVLNLQETKEIDFNKLKYISQKELAENTQYLPRVVEHEVKDSNGYTRKQWQEIHIHSEYQKLFETQKLDIKYKAKIDYIFKNLLGYSNFWKCPTIIFHNQHNQVVDIIAYRPKSKDTGEEIANMKYYYKNQKNRGKFFIYPFENLVTRIAQREKYIIVGEGLKNALNALIYDIPFISIESSSNSVKMDERLLEVIRDFRNKGYGLATAFDGDKSGEEAYKNFLSFTGEKAENVFSFDSGLDFVEYIQSDSDE